jgi:hypothetical protein
MGTFARPTAFESDKRRFLIDTVLKGWLDDCTGADDKRSIGKPC